MRDDNIVLQKSEDFAVRIINLRKYLAEKKHEFELSSQIVRSGTSIGANIHEAICAFSRKDFLAKMYISFKECNETMFWLRLLYRTDYITQQEFDSLSNDCKELLSLLSSIKKKKKKGIRNYPGTD